MISEILIFAILAFSTNLAWEVPHSLLYDWHKSPLEDKVGYYVPRILKATAGDLLILSILFFN